MNHTVSHLVRHQGVPALAYPVSDVSSLWPCTLKMMHVEQVARFVVSLESDVSLQGVAGKQSLSLIFEGHNLIPGKASLSPVQIPFPPATITQLARRGNSRLCVLSLGLKTPCAVWQPRTLSTQASDIANFPRELSALAWTTKVSIVFDGNWLGRQNLGQLRSVAESLEQLDGIPVVPSSVLAQSHRQALWSFYKLVDQAVPSVEEDAQANAPPAYAQVSSKRPRQGTSSSS
jgi:hypothetical protein